MPDQDSGDKGFKVQDRRTAAGSAGGGVPDEPPPAPGEGDGQGDPGSQAEGVPQPPAVDFTTFVLSFHRLALINLGQIPNPMTGKVEPDLASAKETIDVLDVLRAKTEGNRTPDEDEFFRHAIPDLKWKYLDAVKRSG